jgi:hypothetical protein
LGEAEFACFIHDRESQSSSPGGATFLFLERAKRLCAAIAEIGKPRSRMRRTRTKLTKHYGEVLENDRVRVLHIHYAPGEKSVIPYHLDLVAAMLAEMRAEMRYPDGKNGEMSPAVGSRSSTRCRAHQPGNTRASPIDLILVELKKAGWEEVNNDQSRPGSPTPGPALAIS